MSPGGLFLPEAPEFLTPAPNVLTLKPGASPLTLRVYADIQPLTLLDEELGWPLLNYLESMGLNTAQVEMYARDTPEGYPGWSLLLDPTRCPIEALPYLGMYVGIESTLLARQSLITKRNLAPNPGAEINTSGILGGNATISRQTGTPALGAGCYRILATAADYWGLLTSGYTVNGFPWHRVISGVPYQLTFKAKGSPFPRTAFVNVVYSADGFTYSGESYLPFTFSAANSWEEFKFTITPPATATAMELRIRDTTAAVGNFIDVDSIRLDQTSETDFSYFDGDNANAYWLGTRHLSPSALLATETDEQYRTRVVALIFDAPNWKRGTPDRMAAAAKKTLIGGQNVIMAERDTSAYHLTVFTYGRETPDPAATLAALLSQKPIGLVLAHVLITGQTYQQVKDRFATYQAVKDTYADYDAMRRDVAI